MKRNYYSPFFKISTSLLILFLLFDKINISLNQIFEVLLLIKFRYFFISMLGVIIVLWIKSYRWHLILKKEGYHYNHFKSFKAYMSSFSIGLITPGRLGEFIKVYNLRKDLEINSSTAFRTVISDRLFDLFFLLGIGLSGIFVIFKIFGNKLSSLIIILVLPLLYILILFGRFIIKNILEKRINSSNKILKFVMRCFDLIINKKSLFLWLLTFFAYYIYFLSIQALFYSLNIDLNLINTGYIISLIGLVLLLPISIAGFGTREASLVYILSFYNISSELAISFSILQFLVFFIWGGMVGFIFWISSPISIDILKKDYIKIKRMIGINLR